MALVTGLNAPYGARCFLTGHGMKELKVAGSIPGLNAPYGARCFLTLKKSALPQPSGSLNAPYGARCFLTGYMFIGIALDWSS